MKLETEEEEEEGRSDEECMNGGGKECSEPKEDEGKEEGVKVHGEKTEIEIIEEKKLCGKKGKERKEKRKGKRS